MTIRQIAAVGVILGAALGGTYWLGRRHSEPKITWYSDMTNQMQGRKIYLIDTDVSCPPHAVGNGVVQGKTVGHLSVDLNLYNGQMRVVQNTVPAVISCK